MKIAIVNVGRIVSGDWRAPFVDVYAKTEIVENNFFAAHDADVSQVE